MTEKLERLAPLNLAVELLLLFSCALLNYRVCIIHLTKKCQFARSCLLRPSVRLSNLPVEPGDLLVRGEHRSDIPRLAAEDFHRLPQLY